MRCKIPTLTKLCSFYEALLIPFEITALTAIIGFWTPDIGDPGPTAGICIGCIICYA